PPLTLPGSLSLSLSLTDDDGVVIGYEHLAVDVDELCHQAPFQFSMCAQSSKRDVVHPLVIHYKNKKHTHTHADTHADTQKHTHTHTLTHTHTETLMCICTQSKAYR